MCRSDFAIVLAQMAQGLVNSHLPIRIGRSPPPSDHRCKRFYLTVTLFQKEPTMTWAIILLCFILGALIALRPSGRKQDFKRAKEIEK